MKPDYTDAINKLGNEIRATNPSCPGADLIQYDTKAMLRNAMQAEMDNRSISAFFGPRQQRKFIAENLYLVFRLVP